MRQLGSLLGACMAGILVFNVWGKIAGTYGVFGGWLAGFAIISLAWSINHWAGVIHNKEGAAVVDQGLGIAIAGTAMGVFNGAPFAAAVPTLVLCILGGITGGIVAGIVMDAVNKPAVQTEKQEVNL